MEVVCSAHFEAEAQQATARLALWVGEETQVVACPRAVPKVVVRDRSLVEVQKPSAQLAAGLLGSVESASQA